MHRSLDPQRRTDEEIFILIFRQGWADGEGRGERLSSPIPRSSLRLGWHNGFGGELHEGRKYFSGLVKCSRACSGDLHFELFFPPSGGAGNRECHACHFSRRAFTRSGWAGARLFFSARSRERSNNSGVPSVARTSFQRSLRTAPRPLMLKKSAS